MIWSDIIYYYNIIVRLYLKTLNTSVAVFSTLVTWLIGFGFHNPYDMLNSMHFNRLLYCSWTYDYAYNPNGSLLGTASTSSGHAPPPSCFGYSVWLQPDVVPTTSVLEHLFDISTLISDIWLESFVGIHTYIQWTHSSEDTNNTTRQEETRLYIVLTHSIHVIQTNKQVLEIQLDEFVADRWRGHHTEVSEEQGDVGGRGVVHQWVFLAQVLTRLQYRSLVLQNRK